jgi:Protein of unknown function (DUF2905)
MGKVLIVAGLVIAAIGLLVHFGLPIGRLPGDITVRRGQSTFYFPIVTCIILSVLLSLIAMLLRR